MNSTVNSNGQQRKTLAAQIDRLDATLDGLADNLNDAVAQAVKEVVAIAVHEAVRAVLTEVLAMPAMLAKLNAASPPPTVDIPVTQAAPSRLRRWSAACCSWVPARWQQLVKTSAAMVQGIKRQAAVTRAGCLPFWRFKVQIMLALSVGVTLGLASYFAGPVLSAAANGFCGFIATLSIQAGLWLRKILATRQLPMIAASPRRG